MSNVEGEMVEGGREIALSRRSLMRAAGLGAGSLLLSGVAARAQEVLGPISPPSVVSDPPRVFGPGAQPNVYFRDPDVIVVEPEFGGLVVGNTSIERIWTGALWMEGPAWSSQGQYLVFSDIPNDRQMRYIQDDGRVTEFRKPSNCSNGNTFDHQGRQISFEHLMRRVVRYELDGTTTVLVDSFEGKRLNSPNDGAAHPDGSIWFTDPPWGGQLYEGAVDIAGGPSNPNGFINPRIGQRPEVGPFKRELPTQVYRLAPDGTMTVVFDEETAKFPNGLAFSPDYKKVYVWAGARGECLVADVNDDGTVSNTRVFTDCVVDGIKCGADGIRVDVAGNVWMSSNAGRNVGYSGVTCWNPQGKLLGRIRIPEVCGNICFGGPKRNRLFMAASQSLYAIYTNTQGAAPG
jgi:gluconolactonase